MLHLEKDVCGILYASQFSAGEENTLTIRVYGTKGALDWHQEEPNYLWFRTNDGPLSVEWEDAAMDREAGAQEAVNFVKEIDFPTSSRAFDETFATE